MYLLSCLPISPHPIPVVLTGGWKGGGNRWNFWRQIVARSVTARLLYLITGKYGNSWSMTFTFRQFTTRNMEMGAGCLRNLVFVFSHNPFVIRYFLVFWSSKICNEELQQFMQWWHGILQFSPQGPSRKMKISLQIMIFSALLCCCCNLNQNISILVLASVAAMSEEGEV